MPENGRQFVGPPKPRAFLARRQQRGQLVRAAFEHRRRGIKFGHDSSFIFYGWRLGILHTFSTAFRQPAEKILQRLNFGGGGGVLPRVFFDDLVQVRFENAFGAQQRVGSVRR